MASEKFSSAPREVRKIVKRIRRKYYLDYDEAKIIILMRNGTWSKYGTIQVVSEAQRKAGIDADYILTLSAKAWKVFEDKQKRALVDHELAHMVKKETKSGIKYRCRHHDVEEFTSIAERYGAWSKNLERFKKALR